MATSTIKAPTITDSGTNYIKFSDGTLIQRGAVNVTTSTSGGKFDYRGAAALTYPLPFISTPTVMANANDNAGFWNATAANVTSTTCTITLAGNSNTTKSVQWLAIGRWK